MKSANDPSAALALSFMRGAPVSMWACNREFSIVLWTPGAESIYGISQSDAIGKNYLELFVDPPEREQSRIDCIRVIDEGWTQCNCLAYDVGPDGNRRHMLTNVFRIREPRTGGYLQAEIGVQINDLGLRVDDHRRLRELGIELLSKQSDSLEREKSALTQQLELIWIETNGHFRVTKQEIELWGESSADALDAAVDGIEDLNKRRDADVAKIENFKLRISLCSSLDDIEQMKREVHNAVEKGHLLSSYRKASNADH